MSDRLNEYLAREANEFLEQMVRLLSESPTPDPAELLRLARGVRGSAQMAGAEEIARAAEHLERVARFVASRARPWSEPLLRLTLDTTRDLRSLLQRPAPWAPDEQGRLRATLARWSAPVRSAPAPDAGVVPISTLFYDDAGPHVVAGPRASAAGTAPDAVPIERLLLRGGAALREALSLRPRLEDALRRSGGAPEVAVLVEELFDLVQLGLPADARAA